MDLWQMDVVGGVRLADGTEAKVVTGVDDHSRFWKTRTGSSELSTVPADPRRMRDVRTAIAASTTSGADTAKSAPWCSPIPMKSNPTSSASSA